MGGGGVSHSRREILMEFVKFRKVKFSCRRLSANHINSASDSGLPVKKAPSLQYVADI